MPFLLFKRGCMVGLCLAVCVVCRAQEDARDPSYVVSDSRPIPLLSGGLAFVPTWEAGSPTLVSIISPVLLVPFGRNLVFESRAAFEGDFQQRRGTSGDFTGSIDKTLEYMQLDYTGNRYVTITAGRFLTPFNIFNERLYPNWIRNTQTDPLIFPIGTGSDNGIMLRGGITVEKNLNLNYAIYFSTLSTVDHFESERHAGMRLGVFMPRERLEIGASVQHQLEEEHLSRFGLHLVWQPIPIPFELRAEGAFSRAQGNGLWVECAYRLRNARASVLRHTQLVGRTQVFHAGSIRGLASNLPTTDTKRTEFGVNYFLNDGWKALASYGRTFTSAANTNVWTVGMTYRFVIPLGPRE